MKILSFGAVLLDIIEGQECLGGAPFNVAAHLAQCGAQPYMCTSVGRDDRGRRVLAEMDRLGVDKTFVQEDSIHPTGTVTVTLQAGQPSYVIHEDVAWDYIRLSDSQFVQLPTLKLQAVCFGTLDQRCETSRRTLQQLLASLPGTDVFFDVNLRQHFFSTQLIRDSLEHTTILKLNTDEARALAQLLFDRELSEEEFVRAVADEYDLKVVIVTRGDEGCAVLHEGRYEQCQGHSVRVVDAVGAGDAFSAGFLYEYCRGRAPIEAAGTANKLGAFVASHRGAIPCYTESVLAFLR